MSAHDFKALQQAIYETQRLWAPIIEEEQEAVNNQPELSESEWQEIRAAHAVV